VIALLALVCALQEPIVLRTAETTDAASIPAVSLPEGEIGIALAADDLLGAAGFAAAPFVRGNVAVVVDPKQPRPANTEIMVWVTPLPREQAAVILRETPGVRVCIVTGRGGGDVEPLKIGESWMVQAPGSTGLWGRLELRGTALTHRLETPQGKPSEAVAAARKKRGVPADPLAELRDKAGKPTGAAPAAALETGNRACRLRILGMAERASYGALVPPAGRKLLVLDAEFENIIPLTLVQSNQVPTIYRIPNLGDHLYLVVNGVKAARLPQDAAALPGHIKPVMFELERLGTRARGNLVFEIPEAPIRLDLRFYDYSHGHMSLLLKAGEIPEAKPLGALKENEVLEAGVFRMERLPGKAAPEGMAWLSVELRARSRMFTVSDATAFDPKAKPGDKLKVGTVSDWTDLPKHLNVLVDGARSIGSSDVADLGEAPRFIPDVLTGGSALFLVPAKSESLELRCDFPNAKLPSGQIVHPPALVFLLEGKRPEAAVGKALVEIDDDIFKLAVTGQRIAAEVGGQKPPAGTKFLVVEISVKGNGKAGEQFQTSEQLHYATEKGAQVPLHEASYAGPAAAAKLLLVPTGETRRFEAVFAIPETDRRPRLSYRGVTKAQVVNLPALEGVAETPPPPATPDPALILCPKCKAEAGPTDKFCAECGTKFTPK
jgi:hypothetical protein